MIQALERQAEVAKHECAVTKSAMADLQRELEQTQALVSLLQAQLDRNGVCDD